MQMQKRNKADRKYSKELCQKHPIRYFWVVCGELCYVFEEVSSSTSRATEGMSVSVHTSPCYFPTELPRQAKD